MIEVQIQNNVRFLFVNKDKRFEKRTLLISSTVAKVGAKKENLNYSGII